MLLLLKEWKLALAGLFLLSALGMAVGVKILQAQLSTAKAKVVELKKDIDDLNLNVKEKDIAIDQLNALVREANTETERLKTEGDALEARLRAVERRHSAEAATWTAREAELIRTLPAECEAKVREQVRRILEAEQ
jgi:peptidoglycan hydrolase CwlO-like protein